jgi:hypothetical protein
LPQREGNFAWSFQCTPLRTGEQWLHNATDRDKIDLKISAQQEVQICPRFTCEMFPMTYMNAFAIALGLKTAPLAQK